MNALLIAVVASIAALAAAAPSGHAGAVLTGPSGIVTSHGAIGPVGHGLGHGLALNGWGAGLGYAGLGYGAGLGHGAVIAGPVAHGAVIAGPVAHSAVLAAPAWGVAGHGLGLGHGVGLGHGLGLGYGAGVITNGHGAVAVSAHGATVQGPPTAPAVIAGPSGKIVADGLWGPTANVGHAAVIGHGHGW